MAIFCLANGEDDFINKMNKCIIAYSLENKPVYLSQLNISGAMRKIIKNALLPNIVQTLEGNVSLVHGGPFANIAHGCNSIIALKTAMNIAEYTVTEAGFGSDLGAEKFLDIVCDKANIKPNAIVLVVSIRSLKMHGGVKKEDLSIENTNALVLGFENLKQHIKNISAFNIPYIVSINSFNNDTKKEVEVLEKFLDSNNIVYAFDTSYNEGSKGGIDLANRIVSIVNNNNNSQLTPIYNKTETLEEKVNKICTKCYGASGIEYSDNAKLKLKELNNSNAYVCIAKTPLSLTDDEKILIIDKPFKIHVNDIVVANGADFNIAITGNIYRMPGLPKTPEACNM
ncbi:hypothetical protein FACS189459_5310 [Bacilli bacterium]|nr:hypothetical protein FACS189459_5310 [Bacilli bacterium]GHU51761.1 hypothetical protein FACS189496_0710 [Bacilli bacterium]